MNTAAAVLIEDLDEDSELPLSEENIVPSLSSAPQDMLAVRGQDW